MDSRALSENAERRPCSGGVLERFGESKDLSPSSIDRESRSARADGGKP